MVAPSRKGERELRRLQILLVVGVRRVRRGLGTVLTREPKCTVAGECSTADEALEAVRQRQPDIVVLDLSLRTNLGLELVRDLKAADKRLRILVTSVHED